MCINFTRTNILLLMQNKLNWSHTSKVTTNKAKISLKPAQIQANLYFILNFRKIFIGGKEIITTAIYFNSMYSINYLSISFRIVWHLMSSKIIKCINFFILLDILPTQLQVILMKTLSIIKNKDLNLEKWVMKKLLHLQVW